MVLTFLLTWVACGRGHHIESSSGMRQGDPLGCPLFTLAHYRTFLNTIVRAPSCVYPSLVDDIHIMGL
jgi:hypothetical protein